MCIPINDSCTKEYVNIKISMIDWYQWKKHHFEEKILKEIIVFLKFKIHNKRHKTTNYITYSVLKIKAHSLNHML